jgi:hypothetical protein
MNKIQQEAEKRYPVGLSVIKSNQLVFTEGAEFGQSIEQERSKVLETAIKNFLAIKEYERNMYAALQDSEGTLPVEDLSGVWEIAFEELEQALKTYNNE